jgi:hypothetical protein
MIAICMATSKAKDLDDMFELCPSIEKDTKQQNNDELDDMFVDCATQAEQKQNQIPVPKKPKRKTKRTSWKRYERLKTNPKKIKAELAALAQCCAQYCVQFLTWQIVLTCRTMFVCLPTNDDRRSWVDQQLDEMEVGPKSFSYTIPVVDQNIRQCCAKAWRFAYGVPEYTHKSVLGYRGKHGRRQKNSARKTELKARRSVREQTFIHWLLEYAKTASCKLPMSTNKRMSLRLPFPTKNLVYKVYAKHFSDCAGADKALDYPSFTKVWKSAPELKHVKCSKYKRGFSQCDPCGNYKRAIQKQISEARRDFLDEKHLKHVHEFMSEKNHYYAARSKCVAHPEKCMSIIMDAMDQRKTRIPFFTNPPKSVSTEHVLKTKLFAATVHGYGNFFFWCTDQVAHDTNLSIEVLQRTLLKYEHAKGTLPPVLYLQLDNGPDQKSKQFLGFLAYLVQKKIFHKIKVSFLIVGHTHEDIDQKFSVIGKYIQRFLREVLSIPAFIDAIIQCMVKKEKAPKCVEHIQFCYDLEPLTSFLDPDLSRFALPEKTGDNVHYFLFCRDHDHQAVLQYKLKRYSDALWPRKYNVGDCYVSKRYGQGTVTAADPFKDVATKLKFWKYTVHFRKENNEDEEIVFKHHADKHTITVFPKIAGKLPCLPNSFGAAPFYGTFKETLEDQKAGVDAVISKLSLQSTHPTDVDSWREFWEKCPRGSTVPPELLSATNFVLPMPQANAMHSISKKRKAAAVDDGNRSVEIMCHAKFKKSARTASVKRSQQCISLPADILNLNKGDLIVFEDKDLLPTNTPAYSFPFLVGEIISVVDGIEQGTQPQLLVQVMRPCDLKSLDKKFVKWIGDDNQHWRSVIDRSSVQFPVELTARGRKLTAKSIATITKAYFSQK